MLISLTVYSSTAVVDLRYITQTQFEWKKAFSKEVSVIMNVRKSTSWKMLNWIWREELGKLRINTDSIWRFLSFWILGDISMKCTQLDITLPETES